MIPDEAVEAAYDDLTDNIPGLIGMLTGRAVREALESALPYLAQAARQPQRNAQTVWPDVPRRQ